MRSEAELANEEKLPLLHSTRLRLARRSSPAKYFSPAIHFTLLEYGTCIQGANAVSLGTQAMVSTAHFEQDGTIMMKTFNNPERG